MKINRLLFWAYVGITAAINIPAKAQEFDKYPGLFSLSASTTWRDYTLAPSINHFNPNRWVWTGMITLKSTQPVNLQELQLKWLGEEIATLQASLYKKKESEYQLIPIQENLVCDGQWNAKTQNLTFFVDKKIVAVNKYYLVLNFAEKDVQKIKHGSFVIPQNNPMKITYLD